MIKLNILWFVRRSTKKKTVSQHFFVKNLLTQQSTVPTHGN